MNPQLPKNIPREQLELLFLIGQRSSTDEIYIRSAMTIERQRLVLGKLIGRFQFETIQEIRSFHKEHQEEIYNRLKKMGSFALNPCVGPDGEDLQPVLSEQDNQDCAEILRRLDAAGNSPR
ncbi:hypothetical protein [Maritalea mediterranea]|jgi:hypothetical protein|uniref:Uncharacterized protein n=1 Tax=Maritalea mediterranea TaxID=2909667 RepID=A0ABS9EB05_9HYPH|nr:hypothetical protein [Maritalea mediterranea]MCF4098613.1 hypothetical protein [Maritalea mediterranea]